MSSKPDGFFMTRTLWESLRDLSRAAIDLLDNPYTDEMSLQLAPNAQEIVDNLKVLLNEQRSKKHE